MTLPELVKMWQEMADLTRPECMACLVYDEDRCCAPEYCEMAIKTAKKKWGVTLERTGHKRLFLPRC